MPDTNNNQTNKPEKMTVKQAGHMGGQRERELVEEGHQHEHKEGHKGSEFGEKVHRRNDNHK